MSKFLEQAICWTGRHMRSKDRARRDGTDYVSVCRRCGTPMRKPRNGKWAVESRDRSKPTRPRPRKRSPILRAMLRTNRRRFLTGAAASAAILGAGALFWRGIAGRQNLTPAGYGPPVRLSLIPATTPDSKANLERKPPEGFPDLPFVIIAVHGPGDVTISNSILSAYVSASPGILDHVAYVSPRGDDSTGEVDDEGRPFKTIERALGQASTVILEDGDHGPFIYSDNGAKLVRARNVGRARIVVDGPRLEAVQWEEAGGIRSAMFDPAPHRIVDHASMDRDGFPSRLRGYATLDQLREASEGWCYLERRFYVKSPSRSLEAFYGNGADKHIVIRRGSVCFHGLSIDGMACRAEGGELWMSHFRSFCSPDYAFSANGGSIFMETGRIHAPAYDGHNVDYSRGIGLVVAIGIKVTEVGDYAASGRPLAFNLQAGSSHSGFAVVVGCVARRSLGQEYADTALRGAPNMSWYVGNDIGDETYSRVDGSFGFYMQGTGIASRTGYFDTNRTRNVDFPLVLELGAVGFLFNNSFSDARLERGSEAPQTYDPSLPTMAGKS